MEHILKFKFKQRDDLKGCLCTLVVEDLDVQEDGIEYWNVSFSLGDKPYNGEFENFQGRVDSVDVFRGVVNAYLRNDTESFEYLDGWTVFDSLKEKYQKHNDSGKLLMEFPQISCGDVEVYSLELAVPGWRYYRILDDENSMLIDDEGYISTDYFGFYYSALVDELQKIKDGAECLYMSDELKENMDELLEL